MIRTRLLQPDILETLGRAGHASKILVADRNYPRSIRLGPNAKLVSLNLSPGVVSGTQVLEALLSAIPVEAVTIMEHDTEGPAGLAEDPPIWDEYRRILAANDVHVEIQKIDRPAFFEAASDSAVVLTIATAEQSPYANILLQLGVFPPDPR
jgi:L-fucose mutarotase